MLPTDLAQALRRLEADAEICDVLGKAFVNTFLTYKRDETAGSASSSPTGSSRSTPTTCSRPGPTGGRTTEPQVASISPYPLRTCRLPQAAHWN